VEERLNWGNSDADPNLLKNQGNYDEEINARMNKFIEGEGEEEQ
jgi:hypothetical protein